MLSFSCSFNQQEKFSFIAVPCDRLRAVWSAYGALKGKSFLTSESVFVPTEKYLNCYDRPKRLGKRLSSEPEFAFEYFPKGRGGSDTTLPIM